MAVSAIVLLVALAFFAGLLFDRVALQLAVLGYSGTKQKPRKPNEVDRIMRKLPEGSLTIVLESAREEIQRRKHEETP